MSMQSKRVEDAILGYCKGKQRLARFEHIKRMADIAIDKSNGFRTSHGTPKIAGMGEFLGRFLDMLDKSEGLRGEWIVAEVQVQACWVLFFNRNEQDLLSTMEKVVQVSEVMTA